LGASEEDLEAIDEEMQNYSEKQQPDDEAVQIHSGKKKF